MTAFAADWAKLTAVRPACHSGANHMTKLRQVNRMQKQKQDKNKIKLQSVCLCVQSVHAVHHRLWFLLLPCALHHVLSSECCHWQPNVFRRLSTPFCLPLPQNILIILNCVLAAASKVKALRRSKLLFSQLLPWHGPILHLMNCRSLGSTRRLNALALCSSYVSKRSDGSVDGRWEPRAEIGQRVQLVVTH